MPDRTSKKRPRDINQLAASIVEEAIREYPERDEPDDAAAEAVPEKDPAAVELGRRGGKKGGPARAAKLTPEQRREIAKKGAAARWGQQEPTGGS